MRIAFLCSLLLIVSTQLHGSCQGIPVQPCCPSIESGICCGCDQHVQVSHTFMFTRCLNHYLAMDLHLWNEIIYDKLGDMSGALELSMAYQKSSCRPGSARYFLPGCPLKLLVSGDCNIQDKKIRDVRAEWLGLPDDFRGRLRITPQQQQWGFFLEYNQDIGQWLESDYFDGTWISVQAPFVIVENNLNLEQFDVKKTEPTNGGPTNLIEAFCQQDWRFAKISPKTRSKMGLAELKLKLGKAYYSEDHYLLSYYSVVSLPTSPQQNPEYLFDPVIGNNNHIGFGAGVNISFLCNRDPVKTALEFFMNIETIFLVRGSECRTLDLECKPWSRYMRLTPEDGPPGFSVPAMNVTTVDVITKPFNLVDFSSGFRIKTGKFEIEAGADIWGHGDECLELRCPFPVKYGVAGNASNMLCGTEVEVPPLGKDVCTITASNSTISQQADPDVDAQGNATFVAINDFDLDMHSGASQAAFNVMGHVAFGYHDRGEKIDAYFGVGVFFDYPIKNPALQNSGMWGKVGASF